MRHRTGTGITRTFAAVLLSGWAALLLLSGCRSVPSVKAGYTVPSPPDAVLVASTSGVVVHGELQERLSQLFGKDVNRALDRADQVNLALFPDRSFSVLLEGRYPRFWTGLGLDVNRQWQRAGKNSGVWSMKNGSAQIALPGNGVLVYGSPEAERMLRALNTRGNSGLNRDSDLLVFIPAAERLGPRLPVSGECRIVGMQADGELNVTIDWKFDDPLKARTALPLVKITLWGVLKSIDSGFSRESLTTVLDGNSLHISGVRLNAGAVAGLLEKLFPYQSQKE